MFSRHKENRKNEGEKRRRRFFAWAFVTVSTLCLVIYGAWQYAMPWAIELRDFVLNHPYFSVREIRVRGGQRVGGSEIVFIGGLSHGTHIWKINPRVIERKIERHPWVKQVLVRRELPHRIVIEVEERAPKGIVVLGKLYYVDTEGFVFKEITDGERVDYPLLTGLDQKDLLSQAYSTRRKIREALGLADLFGSGTLSISEIHFSPHGGVVIYPMALPVKLHMGWGDWQEKIQRLERVLALWRGREGNLVALDLSFRGQVVAKVKKGWRRKDEG